MLLRSSTAGLEERGGRGGQAGDSQSSEQGTQAVVGTSLVALAAFASDEKRVPPLRDIWLQITLAQPAYLFCFHSNSFSVFAACMDAGADASCTQHGGRTNDTMYLQR